MNRPDFLCLFEASPLPGIFVSTWVQASALRSMPAARSTSFKYL
jgi:hypothetical protein